MQIKRQNYTPREQLTCPVHETGKTLGRNHHDMTYVYRTRYNCYYNFTIITIQLLYNTIRCIKVTRLYEYQDTIQNTRIKRFCESTMHRYNHGYMHSEEQLNAVNLRYNYATTQTMRCNSTMLRNDYCMCVPCNRMRSPMRNTEMLGV